MVWLGDFNRHYSLWDHVEDTCLFTTDAIAESDFLLYTLADLDLHMALPLDVPTHRHLVTKKWSCLDNVFYTPHTLEALISCDTMPALQGPTTDHIPIVSIFDLQLLYKDLPPRQDFHGTDWEIFETKLDEFLLLKPPRTLTSTQEVDEAGAHLINSIQHTITEVIPLAKPCPHSK